MGCIPQNQYNPLLHEIISVHNTEGECNEECGVCCINSICVDNNQTQCAAAGGIWYSGVSCEDVICPSPSPSPSPSISPSPSVSPSVSLSVTPSISITPSLSITPSPFISPSPSLSISPSISPSIEPSSSPGYPCYDDSQCVYKQFRFNALYTPTYITVTGAPSIYKLWNPEDPEGGGIELNPNGTYELDIYNYPYTNPPVYIQTSGTGFVGLFEMDSYGEIYTYIQGSEGTYWGAGMTALWYSPSLTTPPPCDEAPGGLGGDFGPRVYSNYTTNSSAPGITFLGAGSPTSTFHETNSTIKSSCISAGGIFWRNGDEYAADIPWTANFIESTCMIYSKCSGGIDDPCEPEDGLIGPVPTIGGEDWYPTGWDQKMLGSCCGSTSGSFCRPPEYYYNGCYAENNPENCCSTGINCTYCETVFFGPPDWGYVTVSGASNVIYSNSLNPSDPYIGSYDPNGDYYPWFDDSGHMWYMKDYSGTLINGTPPDSGVFFTLTPEWSSIGWNSDIMLMAVSSSLSFVLQQIIWTDGTYPIGYCYDAEYSDLSYFGPYNPTNNETNNIVISASNTSPTITLHRYSSSATKTLCESSGGTYYPTSWIGYNMIGCSLYHKVSPYTTCTAHAHIGGDFYTDSHPYLPPYVGTGTATGKCCDNLCYPPNGYNPNTKCIDNTYPNNC